MSPVKNPRQCVKRSENVGIQHGVVISSRVLVGILSGIYKAMCCRLSTGIAHLPQWTESHTHTGPWDLLIAHPPCTYLSNVSTRAFSLRCTEADKVVDRWKERAIAAVFFMRFIFASALRIAVENPVGFMNTAYRRPDQIIHPYMFAESVNDTENYHTKRTCLWLKGLEPLKPNDIPAPNLREIYGIYPSGKTPCWEDVVSGRERAKIRSKTFPGIAAAMAEQWGESEGEYDTPESNPTQMP